MARESHLRAALRQVGGLAAIAALASCRTIPAGPSPDPAPPGNGVAGIDPATAREFNIPILFTSDEHGWLEPHLIENGTRFEGGMANLLGLWRARFGYQPERFLVLSGGDCWTGPFESTVLMGAPMVEVMNAIGYDAQIVGNHDFDFGTDELALRASEARFPLLAANLFRIGDQSQPPYAVSSTIVRVGAGRVGVIGLANVDTAVLTHSRNVAGLSFTDYPGALRREVAALRAQAADMVVVAVHQEVQELLPLLPLFRELGISFVGSGHSHLASMTVDPGESPGPEDDIVLCNPGSYARSFCHLSFTYRGTPARLVNHFEEIVRVEGAAADPPFQPAPEITAIIHRAADLASASGAEKLAVTLHGMKRIDPDQRFGHVIVDAWLDALPYVQVAITNTGGIRQDIDPGDITMATLVGAMPFNNYLIVVELTGAQLKEVLSHPQSIAGGVRYRYRCDEQRQRQIIDAVDGNNAPIADDRIYKVVVNEFMYRGGDRYRLREYDPTPEETSVHWRDPVARYLREMTRRGQTADVPADGRAEAIDGDHCERRDPGSGR
ncbi:MAG: bifunctional metallophosphatase/5'-nucleotidase [Deltaproteobacteria bacterium]|nr:bifunctional metallophosphatase/5'-nucleotidase [Deltaproteobacteria bacterium]